MITKTTENAIQILLYIGLQPAERIIPVNEISSHLDASPTYLVKVSSHLIKAGLIRSFRGIQGGVQLARDPEQMNLLQIVEACQGMIGEPYCSTPLSEGVQICGFHRAMLDIRQSFKDSLARWTLADLLKNPMGQMPTGAVPACKMKFVAQLGQMMRGEGAF